MTAPADNRHVSPASNGFALGLLDRDLLRRADAVIGVDEVGRGALAGPVVVCAARITSVPLDDGIHDSKTLTAVERETAVLRLWSAGVRWVVCEVGVELIDRFNILEATRRAMRAAARTLVVPGSIVVTDYVDPGDLGCPVLSPVGADRSFFSVAAASIIAKVHRDRIMVDLASSDPRWGWERNKGYGTVTHRAALDTWGRTPHHRLSFKWSRVLP